MFNNRSLVARLVRNTQFHLCSLYAAPCLTDFNWQNFGSEHLWHYHVQYNPALNSWERLREGTPAILGFL